VAVGKVQEYAVAIVGSGGLSAGVVVVHVTTAPKGSATVHPIVPPGLEPPVGPVTIAVSVAEEPSVGVEETAMLIVGAINEIPKDTEFEVADK
jgi:hypothetical protein